MNSWHDLVIPLVALYLGVVLLRLAARLRGEPGQVCLMLGLLVVPALACSYVISGGSFIGALGAPADGDAAGRWWVLTLRQGDGAPTTINLLGAAVKLGALAIGATLVVGLASRLYRPPGNTGWLEIHKALVKWPLVAIGGLVLLEIDLSTIVVGTSVAVVGIGFVLKETLENLFAGVTLELEGTVRRGDMIQVGDHLQSGRVVEKTWRATKLLTNSHERITYPNRLLGSERIKNLSRTAGILMRQLVIGASYDDPPVKVKEILRSILSQEAFVLTDPPPLVRTVRFEESGIAYEVRYWIRDDDQAATADDRILTRVWYAFRHYGVTIPFPTRTLLVQSAEQIAATETRREAEVSTRQRFLAGLPAFASLSRTNLQFLARNAHPRRYEAGEHVLRRGEAGDALYLVQEGSCEACLPDGRRPLPAGRYFGELGLLHGGRRTVDVVAGATGALVLRLDKHSLELLFAASPALRQEFTQVGEERRGELPVAPPEVPILRPSLGRRLLGGAREVLWPF